jgi:hypothetical protein
VNMQHSIRSWVIFVLFSMSFIVAIGLGAAFAQSGSAGGSIGDDQKSISGSRDAPRTIEPAKRASRSKSDAEEPRSRSSGGGGSFDGAWATVSVGCGGTTSGAVVITSGRIMGEGLSGHVSPNGRRQPPELLVAFPGPVPVIFRAAVVPVRIDDLMDVSEAGPHQNSKR